MTLPPLRLPLSSEFSWLKKMFSSTLESLQGKSTQSNLLIPPGDDCAEVALQAIKKDDHRRLPEDLTTPSKDPTPSVLFASDMLMDGVHFDLCTIHPYWAGVKAVCVNLSDIAAMAGTPLSITVSLALPRLQGASIGHSIMKGIADTCRRYHLTIAGGDTNSWDGPLVINVAIIGLPHPRGSLTRRGAQPGDSIFVSGSLGGSLFSGRHLCFPPRLELSQWLRHHYPVTSMLDISDGLASDLRHILDASQGGAILDRQLLPLHRDLLLSERDAQQRQNIYQNPPVDDDHWSLRSDDCDLQIPCHYQTSELIDRALSDGEDFELCWTMPPEAGIQLVEDLNAFRKAGKFHDLLTTRLTKIGEITPSPGTLAWSDGSLIVAKGYEHSLDHPQNTGRQS